MTFTLDNASAYDIEVFPEVFTLHMSMLHNSTSATWEISPFRDDRRDLMTFFNWLRSMRAVMIGFNNIHYDYPIIDFFYRNPNATPAQLYAKSMSIIEGNDRFGHVVWADDRFAPQCDLFKIHHFDNKAKSTGLKALQINMRSPSVVDMPVANGSILSQDQVNNLLIPYGCHDVDETKKFAWYSMEAISFRVSLVPQFGVDVLNWPDTKIGEQMMIDRLGKELCYDYSTGRRKTRQTTRNRIAFNDIIFPYVRFDNPEFQRVLVYLRGQVLTADELASLGSDTPPRVVTKGVFTDLKAHVGGIDFCFGTGGIHASVSEQRIVATDDWLIRDIDVASLYPSIAIVNRLSPAHLGARFTEVYSQLPQERKKWQQEKGKKCVEANALKLAANGVYGKSNSPYSVFYDPQYTMTITVNGQLLLCMLAEKLVTVPTLKLIQVNTDGITYYIHRDHEPTAAAICKEWEKLTALTLEDANYSRMFIRDVNSYIAESKDGSLKLKGAYWSPDPLDYVGSISSAQPPAWHKDLGNVVSVRAAVAAMTHGVDPATFIRLSTNPYDFMCRIKVGRNDVLRHGGQPVQRNTRYYVATTGAELVKHAPPTGVPGAYKKKNRVSQALYDRVMQETGGRWDSRVNTGKANKPETQGRYTERTTNIQAGHKVVVCNDVADFDFSTVNYDWYINEARKLIIC